MSTTRVSKLYTVHSIGYIIVNDEERSELINQAVKVLREDAVYIPFFFEEAIAASRADLKGFRPQAYTGTPSFYDLYLE